MVEQRFDTIGSFSRLNFEVTQLERDLNVLEAQGSPTQASSLEDFQRHLGEVWQLFQEIRNQTREEDPKRVSLKGFEYRLEMIRGRLIALGVISPSHEFTSPEGDEGDKGSKPEAKSKAEQTENKETREWLEKGERNFNRVRTMLFGVITFGKQMNQSPEEIRREFSNELRKPMGVIRIYTALDSRAARVQFDSTKAMIAEKREEFERRVGELIDSIPQKEEPQVPEADRNPIQAQRIAYVVVEITQKLEGTKRELKAFDPRTADLSVLIKDLADNLEYQARHTNAVELLGDLKEDLQKQVIAPYSNKTGELNQQYAVLAHQFEIQYVRKADELVVALKQREKDIEEANKGNWVAKFFANNAFLALDSQIRLKYEHDPAFIATPIEFLRTQRDKLNNLVEAAHHEQDTNPELQLPSDLDPALKPKYEEELKKYFWTPAEERAESWLRAIEVSNFENSTAEFRALLDEILNVPANRLARATRPTEEGQNPSSYLSLMQMDVYAKRLSFLYTATKDAITTSSHSSDQLARNAASSLTRDYEAVQRKLKESAEAILRYPERMSWDELFYEVTTKSSRDQYDWGYWRHTEVNPTQVDIHREWINRTESRQINSKDDSKRALYKIRYAINLVTNILIPGTNAAEADRGKLFSELNRTLVSRSELMRGLTYNSEVGPKVRHILRRLETLGAKRPGDVGYVRAVSYDSMIGSQQGGLSALSEFVDQTFPDTQGYTDIQRQLAINIYVLFDYLTTILLELQRQTQTAGNKLTPEMNRLMIMDAFKHFVHVLTRYEGNEAHPLANLLIYLQHIPEDWGASPEKRQSIVALQDLLIAEKEVYFDTTGIVKTVPAMGSRQRYFPSPGDGLEVIGSESVQIGQELYGAYGIKIGTSVNKLINRDGSTQVVEFRDRDGNGRPLTERVTEQVGDRTVEREVPIKQVIADGRVAGVIRRQRKENPHSNQVHLEGVAAFDTAGNPIPGTLVEEEGQILIRDASGFATHSINEDTVYERVEHEGRILATKLVGEVRELVYQSGAVVGSVSTEFRSENGETLGKRTQDIQVKRKIVFSNDSIPNQPKYRASGNQSLQIGRTGELIKVETKADGTKKRTHLGGGFGPREAVNFDGDRSFRALGGNGPATVRDGVVFAGNVRVGIVDQNVIYDDDDNIVGYLRQTLQDASGNRIGHLEVDIYDYQKTNGKRTHKLEHPGKLQLLGIERDWSKVSLAGSLATWELYEIAEKAWLYMLEQDMAALPHPLTKSKVLKSIQDGKVSLISEWMKNGPGVAKMFPGTHLYYMFVPMLKHYITRIFKQVVEDEEPHNALVDARRKIFWERFIEAL